MKREKIQRLDKAAREIVAANAQRWIATGTDKQKAQARQVLEDIASVEREEEESLVAQVAALSPAQRIVQALLVHLHAVGVTAFGITAAHRAITPAATALGEARGGHDSGAGTQHQGGDTQFLVVQHVGLLDYDRRDIPRWTG